jgi:archaellum component FlaD/FlaE
MQSLLALSHTGNFQRTSLQNTASTKKLLLFESGVKHHKPNQISLWHFDQTIFERVIALYFIEKLGCETLNYGY